MVSQNYSVESFQKINELNGLFTGNIDNEDHFGVSIDNIGDLDGNGVNDLAVGAFSDDDGGHNRGAVWILFLDNNDNVISHTKISDTSGGFTGVLDNNDRFGGAVSYLGDLNGDGFIEIAVGADYDGDGGFWHGAVWILSLNTDGSVNSHSKISDTEGDFTGFINGDAIFGTDIENIGDLNGDGMDDLAVGSRRDNDGGGNEGALWVLFMNTDFTVNSYQKISETEGGFLAALDFEDYFGGSVTNIGDLNGDGVIDLVVGAYRDDDGGTNSGSFYILFLNSDGTVNSYQKVSNNQGNLDATISSNALFGESIDGVVDIDEDGKIELVVGAMRQINPTLNVPTGAFFIIELNSDGTVSEEHLYTYAENCFSGELENNDLFGGSVSFLSATNGDIKIAAGAYYDSENGYRKGAAWILTLGEVLFSLESHTDLTSCGSDDGTITISGLTSGISYTIAYFHNSVAETLTITADASGNYIITGLESGSYDSIVVTEDVSGCTDNLGQIILDEPDLELSISSTDLTSCGSDDGTITISGLTSGNSYTITYLHNSVTETLIITADASGNYIIIGLEVGIYDSILIREDVTDCTDDLDQLELMCFEDELKCVETNLFFSPNNDGFNDFLVIPCIEYYDNNSLKIFNRYGVIVYESNNYFNNWDGKPNKGIFKTSNVLPVGTYFFVLSAENISSDVIGWVYINY